MLLYVIKTQIQLKEFRVYFNIEVNWSGAI